MGEAEAAEEGLEKEPVTVSGQTPSLSHCGGGSLSLGQHSECELVCDSL